LHRVRLQSGRLLITLTKPAERFSVATGPPALMASKVLVRRFAQLVKYNRDPKHHRKRRLTLKIMIRVTDQAGSNTDLIATTKIR
jgi:hypothetical protein